MLYNAVMDDVRQSALEPQEDFEEYAGRWIAVLHGRVVAVGETSEQARLGARLACPREDPLLVRVPDGGVRTAP
jgi:hypothetical protein